MASKSPAATAAATLLLAAVLLLAEASTLLAQTPPAAAAPEPPCPNGLADAINLRPYNYEEVIGGLESLSTLRAAQCVCDVLRLDPNGVGSGTPGGVTSLVEVILKYQFGVLPLEADLPEGFTCEPVDA